MDSKTVIFLDKAYIYQKNHLILRDVNMHFKSGDFAYLIGKTGSGKSSLLKVLYGDLALQKGEGEVVGYNLKTLKTSQIPGLRKKLGIVFQDFQLLMDRSIEKNLEFVLKATGWKDKYSIDARIEKVLDDVGMLHKKHKMPHELSGGEQQRVAIARAFLNSPELILADEPTGNLDPFTSTEIINLLKKISERDHCAVLIATHDYNIIQHFPAPAYRCSKGELEKIDSVDLFV